MEEPLITDVESPPADPAAQPVDVTVMPRPVGRPRGSRSYHNALAKSPHYDDVMREYGRQMNDAGQVPLAEFFKKHVAPIVPEMRYESFRVFIRKFEMDSLRDGNKDFMPLTPSATGVMKKLMKGDEATRKGIELMLNIGASALEEIAAHPEKLTPKERVQLLPIAMRAQDSRINAMARVRQDKRDQLAFEHVFGDAAYSEENE